jgi:hypothetical protein
VELLVACVAALLDLGLTLFFRFGLDTFSRRSPPIFPCTSPTARSIAKPLIIDTLSRSHRWKQFHRILYVS